MVTYEIKQSENGVGKAYNKLMDRINEHVKVLAENGKPITSVMGIKRMLYRYKKDLTFMTDPLRLRHLPEGRTALTQDMRILINDVMDKFDVDILGAVEAGFVGEKEIKRALIKYYYETMAKDGLKYKDIKNELSMRYGVSVSSIEKLVYK